MSVDGNAWKVGWRPKLIIILGLILGGVVGALIDSPGMFAFIGMVAGIGVWLWGRSEVNGNYNTLLENFRDSTQSKVEESTGGLDVHSVHSFIAGAGDGPPLIEPSPKYTASHLLFGETSLVINREFEYNMKDRTTVRGGEQSELFYDQISGVQSENYSNYAELIITRSDGGKEVLRSMDPSGVNDVKSDLQQKMRESRKRAA